MAAFQAQAGMSKSDQDGLAPLPTSPPLGIPASCRQVTRGGCWAKPGRLLHPIQTAGLSSRQSSLFLPLDLEAREVQGRGKQAPQAGFSILSAVPQYWTVFGGALDGILNVFKEYIRRVDGVLVSWCCNNK